MCTNTMECHNFHRNTVFWFYCSHVVSCLAVWDIICSAIPLSLTSNLLQSLLLFPLNFFIFSSLFSAPFPQYLYPYLYLTSHFHFPLSFFLFHSFALYTPSVVPSQMPSPQRQRQLCGTRSAPCWRRLMGS